MGPCEICHVPFVHVCMHVYVEAQHVYCLRGTVQRTDSLFALLAVDWFCISLLVEAERGSLGAESILLGWAAFLPCRVRVDRR